ncbi:MAG: hypothetical protein Q8R05_03640, partial [Candidatus Omnitrophota bacterium]|nr:hypothetical protein [Candidatus Omnitrophota bacterium]
FCFHGNLENLGNLDTSCHVLSRCPYPIIPTPPTVMPALSIVIPAKAGIHKSVIARRPEGPTKQSQEAP